MLKMMSEAFFFVLMTNFQLALRLSAHDHEKIECERRRDKQTREIQIYKLYANFCY